MVLEDFALDAKLFRGSEKRKAPMLAPWMLPAAKLLRFGRKSSIEDFNTYEQLWAYCKRGKHGQSYCCEFASSDPIVRAVAICRTADGLSAVCRSIIDDDAQAFKSMLKVEVYKELTKEANVLLPHCKQLGSKPLSCKDE